MMAASFVGSFPYKAIHAYRCGFFIGNIFFQMNYHKFDQMHTSSCLMAERHALHVMQNVIDVRKWRQNHFKNTGKSIGIVPTMGALHTGHMELVRRSLDENDTTVVSIFVNPTQFAANEDLSSYPRTLENDLNMLKQISTNTRSVDIVFAPTVNAMYPPEDVQRRRPAHATWVDIDGIQKIGEGRQRPTHFRGVCTVVSKLFNIVQPTRAYFGQKDGLQCIVIRRMIDDLNIPVEMVVVQTSRAPDGLALSSRNAYLTEEERVEAPILYRSLCAAQKCWLAGERNPAAIKSAAYDVLKQGKLGQVDYVQLCETLTGAEVDDVQSLRSDQEYMLAVAYKLGKPRLIDNVILTHDKSKQI